MRRFRLDSLFFVVFLCLISLPVLASDDLVPVVDFCALQSKGSDAAYQKQRLVVFGLGGKSLIEKGEDRLNEKGETCFRPLQINVCNGAILESLCVGEGTGGLVRSGNPAPQESE